MALALLYYNAGVDILWCHSSIALILTLALVSSFVHFVDGEEYVDLVLKITIFSRMIKRNSSFSCISVVNMFFS